MQFAFQLIEPDPHNRKLNLTENSKIERNRIGFGFSLKVGLVGVVSRPFSFLTLQKVRGLILIVSVGCTCGGLPLVWCSLV